MAFFLGLPRASVPLSNIEHIPDSKDPGADMGPTCVLSASGGSHVGPMNLAIRDFKY